MFAKIGDRMLPLETPVFDHRVRSSSRIPHRSSFQHKRINLGLLIRFSRILISIW